MFGMCVYWSITPEMSNIKKRNVWSLFTNLKSGVSMEERAASTYSSLSWYDEWSVCGEILDSKTAS